MERLVRQAVLYQVVDVFVETTEPMDRMVRASTVRLKVGPGVWMGIGEVSGG